MRITPETKLMAVWGAAPRTLKSKLIRIHTVACNNGYPDPTLEDLSEMLDDYEGDICREGNFGPKSRDLMLTLLWEAGLRRCQWDLTDVPVVNAELGFGQ